MRNSSDTMVTHDIDSRTGLVANAHFEPLVDEHVQKSIEGNSPLSLLFIDPDSFKKVNDNHGHRTGDEVLAEFAKVIQRIFCNRGIAFRYGGDEFTVLLPNHTLVEAVALAERFRIAVSHEPLSSKEIRTTASVGVAEFNLSSADPKVFIEQADQAMYDAKKLGRDLVRHFGEPLPSEESTGNAQPIRKQPVAQGKFDEQARQAIRLNYFQGGLARCPFDSATLDVTVHRIDEFPAALQVFCPLCGAADFIQGG